MSFSLKFSTLSEFYHNRVGLLNNSQNINPIHQSGHKMLLVSKNGSVVKCHRQKSLNGCSSMTAQEK